MPVEEHGKSIRLVDRDRYFPRDPFAVFKIPVFSEINGKADQLDLSFECWPINDALRSWFCLCEKLLLFRKIGVGTMCMDVALPL